MERPNAWKEYDENDLKVLNEVSGDYMDLLSRCKTGAFLMNVGRGTVIPREALLDPAVTERFAGIWVDVLENEPLPDGDPLFEVEKLLITPHITGGWHLDETRRRIFALVAENLALWLHHAPLMRTVDWKTGYCR